MLMLIPVTGRLQLTKHGHLCSCDSAAADALIQCVPDWASSNNSNLSRLLPAGYMQRSACTTGCLLCKPSWGHARQVSVSHALERQGEAETCVLHVVQGVHPYATSALSLGAILLMSQASSEARFLLPSPAPS